MKGSLLKKLYVALFLSGAASLVYQIIWQRLLELHFGSTTQSLVIILSVFFSGLGLGSILVGRLLDGGRVLSFALPAQYIQNRLKLFSVIEISIAAFGLISVFLIRIVGGLDSFVYGISPILYAMYSVISIFLILIVPTLLMGASLIVVVSALSNSYLSASINFSRVYAVNTIGAVFGVWIAGFWLISYFGMYPALFFAVALNIFTALLARYIYINNREEDKNVKRSVTDNSLKSTKYVLYAVFISGFMSLGLEVIWTRLVVSIVGSSTYSYSIILISILTGVAFGSLASKYVFKNVKKPYKGLVISYLMLSLASLLSIYLIKYLSGASLEILSIAEGRFTIFITSTTVVLIAILFVPTFLMGLCLPAAFRLVHKDDRVATGIGLVYGFNTLGSVFGPLITYYVFISLFGIQTSAIILSLLAVLSGIFIYIADDKSKAKIKKHYYKSAAVIITTIVLLSFNISLENRNNINTNVFANAGRYLINFQQNRDTFSFINDTYETIYYKEGLTSNIGVTEKTSGTYSRTLLINGKADASTSNDMLTQVTLGHLPAALNTKADDVLVIGLGSGVTAGSLSTYDYNSLDIIEIESAVVEAAGFFGDYNNNVTENDNVNIIVDDARGHLRLTDKKYDIITAEPTNPWIAGVSTLFTVEQFNLYKSHLKENGIVMQWVHTYGMSPADIKSVIATLNRVFPHITVWGTPDGADLFLVGSDKKQQYNLDSFSEHIASNEGAISELISVGVDSPLALASLYISETSQIQELTKDANINSDMSPFLEYNAPKSFQKYSGQEILKELYGKRAPLSSIFSYDSILNSTVSDYEAAMIAYTSALDYRNAGNAAKAIDIFYEISAKAPTLSFIRYDIAKILAVDATIKAGDEDYDGAIKQGELAAEFYPKFIENHVNLGKWYLQTGDSKLAILHLEFAVKYNPKDQEAASLLKTAVASVTTQ